MIKQRLGFILGILVTVTFVLALVIEVFAFWPLPMVFYLACISTALAAGVLLHTRNAIIATIIIAILFTSLYFIPWSSRKEFLRDLAKINPGMSVEEVRAVMHPYSEGTGWPANPFTQDGGGVLRVAGTDQTFQTKTNGSGEMEIENSLVFRHNTRDGRFNADWGVIGLRSNRVVSVEFLPD